ncbi:helix-turn-helix transcriptional regulator [Pseudovibrio denitrificans]|uniref:S24 family peptidase n=1 Tax=Pseudovibrio denitrificans TaxID=258256 RepID=UPI0039BF342C
MLDHEHLWAALDKVAERHQLTPSGLARRAGLDPTSFNPSKRFAADGRPRWPSTESLAKVLEVTQMTFLDFAGLLQDKTEISGTHFRSFPAYLCTSDELREVDLEDLSGFQLDKFCDSFIFPSSQSEKFFALEVSSNSFEPYYREGQILIVSPESSLRRNDHVLIATKTGDLHCGPLQRQTNERIEFRRHTPDDTPRVVQVADLVWTARVLWVSQ